MTILDGATLVQSSGSGRAWVLLVEAHGGPELALRLYKQLESRGRVLLVEVATISDTNWAEITEAVLSLLREHSVRQASFIGFASAAVIVQNLCLKELKLARTVVLVDATTRPHPSRLTRIVDAIEAQLPLGLPLRMNEAGFDGKPFLQRIRCPVLIVTTQRASDYERDQATVLARGLPTAWSLNLPDEREAEALAEAVESFCEVPVKCPQK